MLTLEHAYVFAGLVFAAYAALGIGDADNPRRFRSAGVWAVFALVFLLGSHVSDTTNGVFALALALIGGTGALSDGQKQDSETAERVTRAIRFGNALFVPALIIPVTAVIGTLLAKHVSIAGQPVVDPKQATLISLMIGVILAWIVAVIWLRPSLLAPIREGRRLMDTIGWAALLPQMLAALGAVFALAGVGHAVGILATHAIPLTEPFAAVAAYCVGMALFTIVTGNAFAAFPVMTAAIGLPIVVQKFGGNPAIMSAIGMLSGFCGTLVTPMAANFNIVPAALLDLDRNAVIRAQMPTAFLLLFANTLLMYFLAFRFGPHHP
ncbi:MAG TPA: DUF979 domain-containing protein [Rhizomicrobium sp.]|jgi:uncharacterized membrane protein|nr:DUF979 domain-containing protein [Rhizomicrobium sp.]